jgi:plasmid stabilization system protein ParE
MQPQFHPKARAEFEKSALFYHEKFPGLGLEFATQVQVAVAFAFSHPDAGAPIEHGFRRVFVRQFPYSVVYRVQSDRIYILATAHLRRHPNYWNDRI